MSSLTGKILLATPELLTDHIFSQSLILIVENNENGSMGFIFNKPESFNLKDFFKELPHGFQLWNGGPVNKEHLFYIHSLGDIIPDAVCFDCQKNLFFGGDFSMIKNILSDQKSLLKDKIKFFLGYSGWGPGQLEQEIQDKAWFVLDNDLDIFTVNPKIIWKEKLIELNPKNIIWKNSPINPKLN